MSRTVIVVGTSLLLSSFVSQTSMAQTGLNRSWTDSTGTREVSAVLESATETTAVFTKENGERITTSLTRMSAEDAQLIKHYAVASKRKALEKYCDIGYVTCDTDGAIHLGLSQSGCTDNDLQLVTSLPEVASIVLFECDISDDGLAPLAQLEGLKLLHLDETDVQGPGFKHLANLKQLEEFQYSPYDSDGPLNPHLAHLTQLTNLRTLTLRFCDMDASGLRPIGQLGNLEQLELLSCDIESPALVELTGLTKLKSLIYNAGGIDDGECAHLRKMPLLEKLDISGGRIGKAGMEHIASLKKLRRLDLLLDVADADLAPITDLTELRWLRLSGEDIGDAGLAHLATLTHLEELYLPENVSAKGLAHLKDLTKLRRLEFQGENVRFSQAMSLLVDQQGREVLDAMQVLLPSYSTSKDGKITYLDFDIRPKPDRESLKYLRQLPDLVGITLGPETTDEWLADVGQLTQLKSIDFRGDRFDDKPLALSGIGTAHLANCTNLESIEFYDCDLGGNALVNIGSPPKLETFRLSECQLEPGEFAALKNFSKVRHLYLDRTNVGDSDLKHLSALTNLEYVNLPDEVTLKGVSELKSLDKLRSLGMNWRQYEYAEVMQLLTGEFGRSKADALAMFMSVSRDDAGEVVSLRWAYDMNAKAEDLEILKEFPNIERLSLPSSLTDDCLFHCAGLKKLTSLSFGGQQLTDASLANLSGLENLESLYIRDAPITDAGLSHLMELKNLKDVDLHRSKVTKAGVDRLQSAIPDASIRY